MSPLENQYLSSTEMIYDYCASLPLSPIEYFFTFESYRIQISNVNGQRKRCLQDEISSPQLCDGPVPLTLPVAAWLPLYPTRPGCEGAEGAVSHFCTTRIIIPERKCNEGIFCFVSWFQRAQSKVGWPHAHRQNTVATNVMCGPQ